MLKNGRFIVAFIATLVMVCVMVQAGYALWIIITSGSSMFIALVSFMVIQKQLARLKGK